MSVRKLTRQRLSNLRCTSCNARTKKYTELKVNQTPVGYSTTCCNCGKTEVYAFPDKDYDRDFFNRISILKSTFNMYATECGDKYSFCANKNCKFWEEAHQPHEPHPVCPHDVEGVHGEGPHPHHHHHHCEHHCDNHKPPVIKEETQTIYDEAYKNINTTGRKEYL